MARAKSIPTVDPTASITAHAAVAIGTRLDELYSYDYAVADAALVTDLHEMRIAAKRLRYTMDVFAPAFEQYTSLSEQFKAATSVVKLLQQYLGDIHDADVLVPQLLTELTAAMDGIRPKSRGKKPASDPVGVHLVDLDSCRGILSVCEDARSARDEAFSKLQMEWDRLKAESYSDGLRKLLRAAITEQTVAQVLHEQAE